jgi:hypothetical protein
MATNMEQTISLTGFLALWGALVSTFLAGIKVLELLRDRSNIKVSVRANFRVHPPTTVYGDKKYVMVTAANRGRRPATLHLAFILVPKRLEAEYNATMFLSGDSRQTELGEGKAHPFLIDQTDITIRENELVGGVTDTLGNYYFSHRYFSRVCRIKRFRRHR